MSDPHTKIAGRTGGRTRTYGGGGDPIVWDYDYWAKMAVDGNAGSHNHVGKFDDFLGDTLDASWAVDLSTSSTNVLNQQAAGATRLTTHSDDNANCTYALGLHWLVSNGPIFFRARISSITDLNTRAIEVGLSDALTESNGQAFTSHDDTPVAVADDAAIFGFMTDDSMTTFSALSVNGGGTAQVTEDVLTPVAGTFYDFGVGIDAVGNAYFYTGQTPVLVATLALAVATTAVLTPWVSLTNLAGGGEIMDIDYISIFAER